jgi:hypothetical protein
VSAYFVERAARFDTADHLKGFTTYSGPFATLAAAERERDALRATNEWWANVLEDSYIVRRAVRQARRQEKDG